MKEDEDACMIRSMPGRRLMVSCVFSKRQPARHGRGDPFLSLDVGPSSGGCWLLGRNVDEYNAYYPKIS